MTISFPMTVNFSIFGVNTTDEVVSKDGKAKINRRLSLMLKATPDTKIVLANDMPLSSVPVHLSLFYGLASGRTLAYELGEDDVGFLIQTSDSDDSPFVHGSVAWPQELPYYILQPNSIFTARLSLASVSTILDYEPPYSWQSGRENLIRLNILTLECANSTQITE